MQFDSSDNQQVDIKQLTRRTLSYLKALNQEGALLLSEDIEELIPVVTEKSQFRACHEFFAVDKSGIDESEITLSLQSDETGSTRISLRSTDLCKLFKGNNNSRINAEKACVIASTLGIEADRYIKRVMLTNASEGVILDAVFSSYLECLTDNYEDSVITESHTFRFAPGYGDLDISYNNEFYNLMGIEKKLGITISSGGIFLPQKTMLGIVGF